MDTGSIEFYMPRNPMKLASKFLNPKKDANGKSSAVVDGITLEILIRFCTRTKLTFKGVNPLTRDTVYLGKLRDPEYHFVKFEGCMPPVELNMEAIRELASNMKV